MLGILLTDHDVGSVPLLRTDAYGNFIPDAERLCADHHRHRRRRHSEHGDDIVVSGTRLLRSVRRQPPSAPATLSSPTSPTTPCPIGKIADGDIDDRPGQSGQRR